MQAVLISPFDHFHVLSMYVCTSHKSQDKLNIKKLPKAISFHKQPAGNSFLKVPLNEPHQENREHYYLQNLRACYPYTA